MMNLNNDSLDLHTLTHMQRLLSHLVADSKGECASKVITLCGSTRFERLFHVWNKVLSMAGHTVFSLSAFPSVEGSRSWFLEGDNAESFGEEAKKRFDATHKRKIELSDAIVVLNRFAYIGESTLSEIEYARSLGKKVYFLESWGKDIGPGGQHLKPSYREAMHRFQISDAYQSPIRTCDDPSPYALLGPAFKLRTDMVKHLKTEQDREISDAVQAFKEDEAKRAVAERFVAEDLETARQVAYNGVLPQGPDAVLKEMEATLAKADAMLSDTIAKAMKETVSGVDQALADPSAIIDGIPVTNEHMVEGLGLSVNMDRSLFDGMGLGVGSRIRISGHRMFKIQRVGRDRVSSSIVLILRPVDSELPEIEESFDPLVTDRMPSLPPLYDPRKTKAFEDVVAERLRQVHALGWSLEHDDEHSDESIAKAAACYAMPPSSRKMVTRSTAPFGVAPDRGDVTYQQPAQWPWGRGSYKPGPRRDELVKATAMMLAEIERFDRLVASSEEVEQDVVEEEEKDPTMGGCLDCDTDLVLEDVIFAARSEDGRTRGYVCHRCHMAREKM
jgi:hypothetical protein